MGIATVLCRHSFTALLFAFLLLSASAQDNAALTLKTSVRRVLIDVVVTDAQDNPVPGLTKDDFALAEDGMPRSILSFEANGFYPAMDYLPPKLPAQLPNTFANLPATPENGPLYVLLCDLVNMDNQDQMDETANQHNDQVRGRQQLVKFIKAKPEGAALNVFNRIGAYLDGLPGRKNLIWFSGTFPLALYPNKEDPPSLIEESRRTLDLLARNQIAIYPGGRARRGCRRLAHAQRSLGRQSSTCRRATRP